MFHEQHMCNLWSDIFVYTKIYSHAAFLLHLYHCEKQLGEQHRKIPAKMTFLLFQHRHGQWQNPLQQSAPIRQSFLAAIFSKFKHCLTLFPKSFSPFPHGTCSLPDLSCYPASDENYHLLCAPSPRSVTFWMGAVYSKQRMKHGALTHTDALSTRLAPLPLLTPHMYNTIQNRKMPISTLSKNLFVRNYVHIL